MKIYQILIQLFKLIILRWDQSFGGTDQALGQINMWILYNFHPNIPNTRPGCHRCLTSSWSQIHKLTLLMTFVYVLCESTRRVRRQDWFHCISKIYKYWVIELLMDFPRCSQEAILELILKAKFKFQPNIFRFFVKYFQNTKISLTPRQVATDIWNQKPGNLTIWIMYWRCTCPPLNRYMSQKTRPGASQLRLLLHTATKIC